MPLFICSYFASIRSESTFTKSVLRKRIRNPCGEGFHHFATLGLVFMNKNLSIVNKRDNSPGLVFSFHFLVFQINPIKSFLEKGTLNLDTPTKQPVKGPDLVHGKKSSFQDGVLLVLPDSHKAKPRVRSYGFRIAMCQL